MKLEYTINKISGKNKSLCVGDLVKYYGETRYKVLEGVQKLNNSDTAKGMMANLLKKITNNPAVEIMLTNLEELAKKKIFSFSIDGIDPLVFDNGTDSCVLVIEMGDEYFLSKAVYDTMKPGFRKHTMEQSVELEKQNWVNWFEKNLKDYTALYSKSVLEK